MRFFELLPTGDYAVVSEPFANKHNVHVGDSVTLPLAAPTALLKFWEFITITPPNAAS